MFGKVRSLHFVGICGTAMASAAAALKAGGYQISGSDQAIYPPMSDFLAARQIQVRSGYSEGNLADSPDLVVIGNALSRGNPEVEAVLERKLAYCSLPELLKHWFIQGKRSVVVAGTHGKTTTTSLLTWIFEQNGRNPSFLIGGIPRNLGQGARFTESEWFVIEGDEYDTAFFDKRSKFVHYLPEIGIINNLEFDHADIFENLAAVQTAFRRFINLIPRNGLLLANGDDPQLAPLLQNTPCPVLRFGFQAENQLRIEATRLEPEHSSFQLGSARFTLGLAGELNVRNAAAAAACALHTGLTEAQIQWAFDSFRGIKRRMETRGSVGGVTVIDDFGHHPTAIAETLRALRVKFPGQRIWALFEPRSNTTRRRVFQKELAQALAAADAVVVSEVARLAQLAPEERLNPEQLIDDLNHNGTPAVYLADIAEIVSHVTHRAKSGDVICVFSNGSFGGVHEKILESLATHV